MKDIQNQASNPKISALVSASAGTGKTKMLVDRLTRLLLNGIEPESILCLTFTKAAASEMMDRLLMLLEKLTLLDDDAFQAFLTDIDEPYTSQKNHIRQTLYFHILNLEGGLKIQTLHSFCQGLIESNIWALKMTPPLIILDDRDRTEYLERAIHDLFSRDEWKNACDAMTQKMSYKRFMDLIKDTITLSYQDLERARIPFPVGNLSDAIQMIMQMIHTLPSDIQSYIPTAEKDLFSFFINQEGKARKSILKKEIIAPYPLVKDTLSRIAQHFETLLNARKIEQINHLNDNFFGLCSSIKEQFQNDKHQASSLDFNDLIEKAHDLLKHPDSGNLERMLGYRLNAILVDEAQDTSPLQWGIIDDLVHNMLMADAHDQSTVFIVGDLKQSIYSFQGSRPDLFMEKSVHYHELFQEYHKKFKVFDLDTSYRSSVHVLHAVDTVFNTHKQGVAAMDAPPLIHRPHRQHARGGVYLAPLEDDAANTDKNDTWQLPHARQTDQTQTAELGQKIAWCVMDILSKDAPLHATHAKAQPQDIMILVRSRNTIVEAIHQALLSYNIPVSGLDRFQLNDHIIVQDLLCLAEWLCAPRNDYALACLLKSPLFGSYGQGISETDLHTLCTHQGETDCLWDVLSNPP
ncbi:MAG: UvrD-helicase domain-containing protein, partial [Alphaproteobacteria bacterium]|nr:UvrD-helicase domain-containing protein [Alphaproteobacteria bacterium]